MPKTTHDVTWTSSKPVTITPERAQKGMEIYYKAVKEHPEKRNRAISKNRVFEYTNDMAAGKWRVNGETIKFDEDGVVIDGQHRLLACIKSGKPIEAFICYNVPRDTFDTIDIGCTRTATQVLNMMQVRYSSNVAAIINGTRRFMEHMPEGCVYASNNRLRPNQMHELYNENAAGFADAAEFASKYNRTGMLTQKMIGTLYYYLIYTLKQDADMVRSFLIDITLDDTVPNLLENNLRKKLYALKGWPTGYDRVRLSMIVKTWNALATGATKLKLPNCDAPKALNLNPEVPQFENRNK